MAITTKDLKGNYRWSASRGDNPRRTGSPDNDLLNRQEGYEVLDFINAFLKKHGLTDAAAAKVERLIHAAPGNVRSRSNLMAWIADNWKSTN